MVRQKNEMKTARTLRERIEEHLKKIKLSEKIPRRHLKVTSGRLSVKDDELDQFELMNVFHVLIMWSTRDLAETDQNQVTRNWRKISNVSRCCGCIKCIATWVHICNQIPTHTRSCCRVHAHTSSILCTWNGRFIRPTSSR